MPIVGVRPALNGAYVALLCAACGATTARYQHTVAGLAVGVHRCDGCGAEIAVEPEEFAAAASGVLPATQVAEAIELTEEASAVVERWHRLEPFRGRLEHLGVDLAAPTERETVHIVLLGLLSDMLARTAA